MKSEMLLESNWDCIVVSPYLNSKFKAYAEQIDYDADDLYDEVGMSCFKVWDIYRNIDTFARDILNENFDWRISIADADDYQPEDIEPAKLHFVNGEWKKLDYNLQQMIAK
jgi:hypothetical protein